MAAPQLRWYETDDVTPAAVIAVTPTTGTPTAAVQKNLFNDFGGALDSETATQVRITALSRNSGAADWSADDELAASGMIEARAIGSGGTGIVDQVTPWTAIGRGRYLYLDDMPKNCKREIEVRVRAFAGVGTQAKEILLRPTHTTVVNVLDEGHEESGGAGVCHGIGDGRSSGVLEGGVMTEAGTPDNTVEVSTVTWRHQGVPHTILAHALTFNDEDVASAALASGEAYGATASLGDDGTTVTITKGAKATAPLPESAFPAVPDGEIFLGYVEVPFDATIETADIDQDGLVYDWFGYTASGLNVTMGRGKAMADSKLFTFSTPTPLAAFSASSTIRVWLETEGNGSFAVTTNDAARPSDRALLLWQFTTDGSGITAAVRRHGWTGRELVPVAFEQAGTITSTSHVKTWPRSTKGYVFPLYGIVLGVDDNGSSGATSADILTSDAGAAFVSLFTSGAGEQPSVDNAAADPVDRGARPELFEVPAFGRIKATVTPAGGTPTNLSLTVLVVPVE